MTEQRLDIPQRRRGRTGIKNPGQRVVPMLFVKVWLPGMAQAKRTKAVKALFIGGEGVALSRPRIITEFGKNSAKNPFLPECLQTDRDIPLIRRRSMHGVCLGGGARIRRYRRIYTAWRHRRPKWGLPNASGLIPGAGATPGFAAS